MAEEKKLTGYPSIDKPWLKYYSEEAINAPLPECTMYEYIWENNKDHLSDIALRYYGTKITYGKLFERIKKAASALYAMGVRKGDIVTIMSMHTPETIICIYALNYLGAVANMVYMTLAEKEILHTLSNTKSKMLFVLDVALEKVNKIANRLTIPIVVLGTADDMPPYMRMGYKLKVRPIKHGFMTFGFFLQEGKMEVCMEKDHTATAIIVYTSGSTGEPKGVMLSNDALNAHSFQEKCANFGFERKKSFLHILPTFLGFGISHVHLALNNGIDSYLWIDLNPHAIVEAFFKIKPNFFVCGPAFIDAFLQHKPENLRDLLLFVGGGGALAESKEHEINAFLGRCGTHAIYANGYGMTETSSTLCCNTNDYNKPGSVGLPMPKTIVKIIDPDDERELTYGEIGELCFLTPNMMSGYFHNENETKKIFLAGRDGTKWIRTGDLGKVDEDGYVFVVGRIKRIEITRGSDGVAYKLFPLHIEETLEAVEIIEKCAVLICDDKERINAPILFVTLKNNVKRDQHEVDALWDICKKNLSAHEYPRKIYRLDSMPMTASGKIDYLALEEMTNTMTENISV